VGPRAKTIHTATALPTSIGKGIFKRKSKLKTEYRLKIFEVR
jgi:hypothetical protein